jgi:hypothetical protein
MYSPVSDSLTACGLVQDANNIAQVSGNVLITFPYSWSLCEGPVAQDVEVARRLWEVSEAQTRVCAIAHLRTYSARGCPRLGRSPTTRCVVCAPLPNIFTGHGVPRHRIWFVIWPASKPRFYLRPGSRFELAPKG